jgi:flagellar FliJ protein
MAMRGLATLIRAQRWRVDAVRREIAGLEGISAERRAASVRFEAEVVAEQARARADDVARFAYAGGYVQAVIARRAEIAQSILDIEAEIAARREDLAEIFAELKRYEIVRDQRAAREAAEEARREAIAADELGLELHRRREA